MSKLYRRSKRQQIEKPGSLEGEEWVDVPGLQGYYQASSFGRVKTLERTNKDGRLRREKLLKYIMHETGYFRVQLYYPDGKKPIMLVHRIICTSFHNNSFNKPQVNHINGIKTDNSSTNLEWVTLSENSQHAINTGLFTQIGEKTHFAKLSNNQAIEIYLSKSKVVDLMAIYNISKSVIYAIKSGLSWKQVILQYKHLNNVIT